MKLRITYKYRNESLLRLNYCKLDKNLAHRKDSKKCMVNIKMLGTPILSFKE